MKDLASPFAMNDEINISSCGGLVERNVWSLATTMKKIPSYCTPNHLKGSDWSHWMSSFIAINWHYVVTPQADAEKLWDIQSYYPCMKKIIEEIKWLSIEDEEDKIWNI